MRVSIINPNLVGSDAIGQCVLHQIHYFHRRGDDVRVYTEHSPLGVPPEDGALVTTVSLEHLAARRDECIQQSDLYVYHYPAYHPIIDTIRGLDRGSVIFYYHNVTPPELWDASEDREALRHSLDCVAPLSHYADLIVTGSAYNAQQLAGEHGLESDRIRVLPLGVDLTRFTPGEKDAGLLARYGLTGKRVLLFAGRLAGNKRVDLLVDALADIRRRVRDAVLLIVGDQGSSEAYRGAAARLRLQIERLGLSDAVILAGTVDDLPGHMRLADVYVSASLHEGFGLPLLEAMATGVPLVVTDATAHPWVAGAAALLCRPGNSADMADKVVHVLGDADLRRELVQKGLARAREFGLEQYDERWGQIVAEVTGPLPIQPNRNIPGIAAGTWAVGEGNLDTPERSEARASAARAAWRSTLQMELGHAEALSDVMLRGYAVRSRVPIVGGLVAWIRRNLTSHLREPYVDPTFERQVAFNRQMLRLVRHLIEGIPAPTADPRDSAPPREPQRRPADVTDQLDRMESLLSDISVQLGGAAQRSGNNDLGKPPQDE